MAPILGIMASQITGKLFAPTGAYDSIATTTVGAGGVSSVTFSSIPSTYSHLQIRGIARSTSATTAEQAQIQFNSNTSNTKYAFHSIIGNGTAASAEGYATGVLGAITPILRMAAANATASIFGVGVIDILDYANTNKYKTVRSLNGNDRNGSGEIIFMSGLWLDTSAISTITITQQGGSGIFAQYSSFALYGIKAGA